MSRGLGRVERRILQHLRQESRQLTTTELCAAVFKVPEAAVTKSQRRSVRRALARLMQRDPEFAWQKVRAWRGRFVPEQQGHYRRLNVVLQPRPKPPTPKPKPPPPQIVNRPIWAYRVGPKGPEWRKASIVRVTATQRTIEFNGERITTDRGFNRIGKSKSDRPRMEDWEFTEERKNWLEESLWQRYRMTRAMRGEDDDTVEAALELLGLSNDYTDDDILKAFRVRSLKLHPDQGGDATTFRALVKARDLLLSPPVNRRN